MMLSVPVSRAGLSQSVRVLESLRLCNQRVLQDDSALLVLLTFLCGKLVHPSQFLTTVLAHHIPDHVSTSQHHSVLDTTVGQVDDPLEEVGTSCNKDKGNGGTDEN